MHPQEFTSESAGRCLPTLGGYHAFFPNPLPPKLEIDWELASLLSAADQALAELSGAGQLLPNPHLLIRPYLRREAVLSSLIENTIAGVDELFYLEAGEENTRNPDLQEVANHVRALEQGLARLTDWPISTRLLCELHSILLSDVRGGGPSKTPGEFRRSQNWIGKPGAMLAQATFVPPPPDEMQQALGEWETYLHSSSREPTLVKCALLHYQFEAIHPFLDGNGRIGRLLITLFLCASGRLSQPLLYLSGFFEEHRDEYYRRLLAVSREGDWRGWIDFFLRGVQVQASRALDDTRHLLALHEHWRLHLKSHSRAPKVAHNILDEVFANPVFSTARYSARAGIPFQTVSRSVDWLVKAGFLREVTGNRRNRLFVSDELMRLMSGQPKTAPSSDTNSA